MRPVCQTCAPEHRPRSAEATFHALTGGLRNRNALTGAIGQPCTVSNLDRSHPPSHFGDGSVGFGVTLHPVAPFVLVPSRLCKGSWGGRTNECLTNTLSDPVRQILRRVDLLKAAVPEDSYTAATATLLMPSSTDIAICIPLIAAASGCGCSTMTAFLERRQSGRLRLDRCV